MAISNASAKQPVPERVMPWVCSGKSSESSFCGASPPITNSRRRADVKALKPSSCPPAKAEAKQRKRGQEGDRRAHLEGGPTEPLETKN
jgi:hypothetical protein